ncbi:MAG: ABC-ATPase domain-containing protein, partial [Blautia sp.]|nr:ABC-ATPase domain-containing protein [Blautia sp.]
MFTSQQLRQQLSSIHRKSYPAYKTLKGIYDFKHFLLSIDHVQGDPFASPSHLSIQVPAKIAAFPAFCFSAKNVRIAVQDYLLRKFSQQLSIYNFKAKGSGKSGSISTSVCGQEVLERTACEISSDFVTVRFTVGFPANGRTINAFELEKILFEFLPSCVEKSLLYKNLSQKAVESVVFLAEDQEFLRQELKKR